MKKTINIAMGLVALFVGVFLMTKFFISIHREKVIEAEKVYFMDKVNEDRCKAGAEYIDRKMPQWRVIKNYSTYHCYVFSHAYWMEIADYDLDKMLNQR